MTVREALGRIALLEGVAPEHLDRLAERAVVRDVPEGARLFGEGDSHVRAIVLVDGSTRAERSVSGEAVVVARHTAPNYFGWIAMLTGDPAGATMWTTSPARIAEIGPEAFAELVRDEPRVVQELTRLSGALGRTMSEIDRQREKLAALGSLSAGLAHELNNPAAAARRAAETLRPIIVELAEAPGRFAALGLDVDRTAALAALSATASEAARRSRAEPVDALDASDREEALATALEARGLDDAWRLAGGLSEAGLDERWVDEAREQVGANALAAALEHVLAVVTADGLISDLVEATGRVSNLVGAMKEYSYRDRGGRQEVDVHDGLESTLTILGHKLRRGKVRVVRDYDRTLPPIAANGPELNQVWTNLLDNAIDAVDGAGDIRVRTAADGDGVIVEVADGGPGIPPDVQSRIFEPFFTTKDPGQGTGLGLDVTHRIVMAHGGQIDVASVPGDTRFTVRLPRTGPAG